VTDTGKMKTRSKIIVTVGVAVLVFAALAMCVLVYYYTHPPKIKALLERLVSSSVGASLSIQRMTYSRNPLRMELEGIRVESGKAARGFSLDVLAAAADFSFEGSWGHRALVVKNIKVSGFISHITEKPEFSGLGEPPANPSFFGGLLRRLFTFFVFGHVRFESAEIHEGLVSVRLGERTLRIDHIRANLEPAKPFEIFCGVQAKWPSQGLNLVVPHVSMKADQKLSLDYPEIGGFLSMENACFESPMAGIRDLEAKTRLLYQFKERKLSFSSTELVSGPIDVKNGTREMTLPSGVHITTGGGVHFGSRTLHADPLQIALGDGLLFEGSADARFGTQMQVLVKILKSSISPNRLRSLLPREIKALPVTLIGPLNLTGNIKGLRKQNGENAWTWEGNFHGSFKQNRLSVDSAGIRGNGNISGDIQAEGTFPDIQVSGAMKASDILLSGVGVDLKPFTASLSLSGSYPSYDLKNLSVLIPAAKRVYEGREFLVRNLSLKAGEGRLDAANRTLSLPAIRIDSSLLKNLQASLNVEKSEVVMKIRGRETGLLESAGTLHLLPPGWKASGADRMEVEARRKGEEGYALSARVTFDDLSFQNNEGTSMGQALSVKAEMAGMIAPSFSKIEGRATVNADSGEVLFGRFYFNLQKDPFLCSGEGQYNVRDRRFHLADATLGLKSILQLNMNGDLLGSGAARSFDASMNIHTTPLGPAFTKLLKEPFQTEKPVLTAIDADGSLSGDCRLKGSGSRWTAKGRLNWKEGNLSIDSSRTALEGIDLSLPLWYRNYSKEKPVEPLKGKFSVRMVKAPFFPSQALDLSLLARPNTLSIPASTTLKIPGGKVRIGPLVAKGLADMNPSCDTSLGMDSVNLGPLLGELKLPVEDARGTLNGNLESIHVGKGIMRSKGQMEANVFGGSVVLSNIGASGLFTSTPVLDLNARWHDLDLAKLTTGSGFGKIQGVLNGHVNRLEIAEGQPQGFDLLLETVKKKGVPQRISVKAVDHIAELGGGQSPFVGAAGMFASLFKEFPYEKIGIYATLENDVFRINGTIKEGGTEYLVKRGFISGVNVINQNPDNRVSFKDMIKRLKRVSSTKTGPVIK
jgi:hypothetical protein